MADHSPSPPQSPKHRNPIRKATRLADLTKRRANGRTTSVDIDVNTGIVTGQNGKIFQSYLGVLVREHISILVPSWEDVKEVQKNLLWQDILLTFDIPNVESLRQKVMASMGNKFRQFKSKLTTKYIYNKDPNEISMPDYRGINQETWDEFVRLRLSSEWQEKRKKAKQLQSQNTCPHILSRGGYSMLEEKMMMEKQKQKEASAASNPSISMVDPPSPPSRHEKWKMARMKKSGDYTLTDSKSIAEKIDSLVEQSSQGSFVPHGRDDILTAAIGKPEHPGRVRGIGHGVGIRQYFGKPGHPTMSSSVSQETIETLRQQITEEVTRNLRQQITTELTEQVRLDVMQQLGLQVQQKGHTSQGKTTVGVSTKGSCSPDGSTLEDGDQCGLYVEENPIRLVAIGRISAGGGTIHCRPMDDDVVRVAVEKAHDGAAAVPLPTEEVQVVAQALNTFLAWPKHLVKPLSTKVKTPKKTSPPKKNNTPKKIPDHVGDPLESLMDLANMMRKNTIALPWDPTLFGIDSSMPLHIHMSDCLEIYSGEDEINMTQMQLWLMFLHSITVELGNDHVYGFLKPQSMLGLGDQSSSAKTYVMDWIGSSNKRIYLAPYLQDGHWQLIVLCPSDHVVVFFCSLHKAMPAKLKKVLEGIHVGHHMLVTKSRSRPKLKFLTLKPNRQTLRPQCGFYVMQWMENIIRMGIIDSWVETFSDTAPFIEEVITHTRQQWAGFLLACRQQNTIEDDNGDDD